MALVHVVLIWGTNNTTTDNLTAIEIMHRQTGSKLVLAARIFYAAFIWMAKFTVLEFLKRTIGASWAKSYEWGLRAIYVFLALTYIAVMIGTLAECQPFDHYWQVVPDPGPQCREGLVQLLVMGVCDIVTDVVLVAFPIPVVLRSTMPMKKKLSLIGLFLLSGILIGVTAYRVPSTIDRQSDQTYRSLLASLEILAATFVSNAVIIGSFIRDKGVKKAKFRAASVADSTNGVGPLSRVATARSAQVTMRHWGSDEDLVSDLGMSLPSSLHYGGSGPRAPSAAPAYEPALPSVDEKPAHSRKTSEIDQGWTFRHGSRSRSRQHRRSSVSSVSTTSIDIKLRGLQASMDEPVSPGANMDTEPLSKQMSFFDVGGLVDAPKTTVSQTRLPEPAERTGARGRSGSKQFLSDIGGMLSRHKEEDTESDVPSRTPSKLRERRKFSRSPNPAHRLAGSRSASGKQAQQFEQSPQVRPTDDGPDALSFGDVGGLLK
ncbi:uncharacterized protein AB675_7546 [Cyphellophora attinorum]|uniref:Rhodopsin domain-containing protein n=1 Tax=Cyphellophora attinorum TaxID=1664694 RepID=A0A0N1NYN9_9EURO|nr:uncharacterized protein AB675_7546 [Phialophora attinorum]KPI40523.1 hypothetical protein AB675_7546 [Phialophora attinorum]